MILVLRFQHNLFCASIYRSTTFSRMRFPNRACLGECNTHVVQYTCSNYKTPRCQHDLSDGLGGWTRKSVSALLHFNLGRPSALRQGLVRVGHEPDLGRSLVGYRPNAVPQSGHPTVTHQGMISTLTRPPPCYMSNRLYPTSSTIPTRLFHCLESHCHQSTPVQVSSRVRTKKVAQRHISS